MIYDIEKSYEENVLRGPIFCKDFPLRRWPRKEERVDFLGHKVASRLGVPAGPLLNSEWVSFAARLGFDVVTYKTIRSHTCNGHSLPNIVYIDSSDQLFFGEGGVMQANAYPSQVSDISITNSFGMPSQSPEFLFEDIQKANASLSEGQVMVVSITGSEGKKSGFLEDFVDTALIAKEAGAKVIEANFSCPNVGEREGLLYMNPKAVFETASLLVAAIENIPLIIKVGAFPNREIMRPVFIAAGKAGVKAISGINSVSKTVRNSEGISPFGSSRSASGICGAAIREAALAFVKEAHCIISEEGLDIEIIGVGGVSLPEHIVSLLESGAKIVQSATGMMWNPLLAMQYHEANFTVLSSGV